MTLLALLAAPSLVFFCGILFIEARFLFAARSAVLWDRFFDSLVPYLALGEALAVIGSLLGSKALLARGKLNSNASVNALYVILLWLGVLALNGFVIFPMCAASMIRH